MLKPKLFYTMERLRDKISTDRIDFNDVLLNFNGVWGMHAIIDKIEDFEEKASDLSDKIFDLQVKLMTDNIDLKTRRKILRKINKSHKKVLKMKEEISLLIKGE